MSTSLLQTPLRRGVIAAYGPDANKLVQSLASNTIAPFVYAGFFNAPGRLQFDTFIYAPPSQPDLVLIEHDSSVTDPLNSFIKKFILRSKVRLFDVSAQYQVWAAWEPCKLGQIYDDTNLSSSSRGSISQQQQGQEGTISETLIQTWNKDPRARFMGWRRLAQKQTYSIEKPPLADVPVVDDEYYRLHRYLLGIPEGSTELIPNSAIPLESNMDYMAGIDFYKGCYVGQELTARTHHKGVTRKRIVPVRIFQDKEENPVSLLSPQVNNDSQDNISLVPLQEQEPFKLPESQLDVRPSSSTVARPRPAGKICGATWAKVSPSLPPIALGLALVRLENLSDILTVNHESDSWYIKGFAPAWWSDIAKSKS